jgi:hypothetical protein
MRKFVSEKLISGVFLAFITCNISLAADNRFSVYSPDKRTELKIGFSPFSWISDDSGDPCTSNYYVCNLLFTYTMTNWTSRNIKIKCDFLDDGIYNQLKFSS